MSDTLLLIEDDRPLAALTAEFLRAEGFSVAVEHRGDRAAQRILDEKPALLILDVMLPGIDGFTLCRQIREQYPGLILMMTALDENAEQLTGFNVGADDYVVKPVDPLLLLARIRSLLRRHPQAPVRITSGARFDWTSTAISPGSMRCPCSSRWPSSNCLRSSPATAGCC
jgi:two-component system OmpR family response regulator/two-component system response regulator RstA